MSHRENYMNSIDNTATMVAKGGVAAGGTAASFSDTLQDATVLHSNIPWSDVAAIMTCIYTLFLICDWLYKKVKVYREWKRTRCLLNKD